ncbi:MULTISPECIES: thioredoxin-dependent thiol peroxidase [Paenibacillus]|uniref:thioredoxin-dependent thiol peroxidase n=1 Tax=Paenibacillus TaxID=44249 RepID=UPI0011AA7767|nr:thioredoxin-dependent thiol peroxidase [Paenibacillus lactis]MCM3493963.1 thioredoxin-dependent thiol peroxidase [Paenibacillus lactis]GIO94585.1 peroxiredoxin [Paenibacillus lactis]
MKPSHVEVGSPVPDFTLPASSGENVSLSDFRGRKVVLFFYPKNMTPTCTEEACSFRDHYGALKEAGAVVIGISPDPLKSHAKFIDKHSLPYLLLADEEHKVSELFGVWQLKKMFGREYMGIVRSTFLIDEKGRLAREWRKVKVKGHVEAVLEAVLS